jgi:hypothetical protein
MMVYDTTLTTLCIWNGTAWDFVVDNSITIQIRQFNILTVFYLRKVEYGYDTVPLNPGAERFRPFIIEVLLHMHIIIHDLSVIGHM